MEWNETSFIGVLNVITGLFILANVKRFFVQISAQPEKSLESGERSSKLMIKKMGNIPRN